MTRSDCTSSLAEENETVSLYMFAASYLHKNICTSAGHYSYINSISSQENLDLTVSHHSYIKSISSQEILDFAVGHHSYQHCHIFTRKSAPYCWSLWTSLATPSGLHCWSPLLYIWSSLMAITPINSIFKEIWTSMLVTIPILDFITVGHHFHILCLRPVCIKAPYITWY